MKTLDRLLSFSPERMFLTHYGCVENVPQLAEGLRAGLQRYQAMAQQSAQASDRHAVLFEALMGDAIKQLAAMHAPVDAAKARELLNFDIELNAQGLEFWLDHAA